MNRARSVFIGDVLFVDHRCGRPYRDIAYFGVNDGRAGYQYPAYAEPRRVSAVRTGGWVVTKDGALLYSTRLGLVLSLPGASEEIEAR